MFARVSTYKGDTGRLLEGFRRTTEPLSQLEGFERAYLLTNAATGRAMTVTVWESELAMDASAEWGRQGARACCADTGAAVESVEIGRSAFASLCRSAGT